MGDRCIDCNSDIRERDDCGGIGHIGKFAADLRDVVPRKQFVITAAQVGLDADEGNPLQREQRLKQLEIDRTIAIVGVTRVARPGKSDAFSLEMLDR